MKKLTMCLSLTIGCILLLSTIVLASSNQEITKQGETTLSIVKSEIELDSNKVIINDKIYTSNPELEHLIYDYLYNGTVLSTQEMIRTINRIKEITSHSN